MQDAFEITVMSLVIVCSIDAPDDGRIDAVGWCGDQHLARAGTVDEGVGAFLGRETAGAFERHVDALIGNLRRILLGGHLDRADRLAVVCDGDAVALDLHLAGKAAVHAVVAEQVGVRLDAAEVVDGDGHDVLGAAFDDGAQYEATDAPESVDGDLDGHDVVSLQVGSTRRRTAAVMASGVMPKCR